MKKKFTFLIAALMLLSLISQPMRMWGQTRTETTIASWGKVSIAANTAIKATGGDTNNNSTAQYISTKAMTIAGTYCYYGSSAGGAVITFSNLDLSGYSDITMTFYTRASQQGKMQIAWSSDGTNYTNLNAPSITKSEALKTSDPIPNSATHIKLTHDQSSGSLYFGTINIKGTASAPSYTIEAASNNDSWGTVSLSGSVITGSPKSGCRYADPAYTVSPANSATVSQNGNAFTVTPSANTTVTINFEAIPTHTATFSVNGVTTTQDFAEGAAIVFPSDPEDINGKSFVGWYTEEYTNASTPPSFVNTATATMGNADVTYYAVFATVTPGTATTITDELDRSFTGVTGTSYLDWSDKTGTSGAVYAGQSAGGNNSIQLRSNNNNSGVVTTASGGKAKKVTITWNSNTETGRTLNIYGKNSAYSQATDLYGNNSGTLLGTVVYGTSTELTISGDYEYIGMRSASGAMYITTINIDWETGTPDTYSDYCTTVATPTAATPTFSPVAGGVASGTTVTINCATEGATIYYTTNGDTPTTSSAQGTSVTINAACTIKAIAVKDGYNNSEVATASYTILATVATPSFSHPAGTYSSAQSVTISCATDGATIYYTTNGDVPTTESTVYSAPIAVSETTTIKAIATKDGMANSAVAEATYSFPTITATPASLSGFAYVEGSGPSTTQTISVSGSYLSANISLTLGESSNFELSLSENGAYTNSLKLTQSEGSVAATTIYVRMKADLSHASYNGTITLTSTNATNVSVSLSGSVTEPEAAHVTWDLSTDQTATATTTEMTWTSSYATMGIEKHNASTNTNNYYPGTSGQSYSSTRFYKNSKLTLAPVSGYVIESVVFTATTSGYATTLQSSSWTNATASVDDVTVTITPTDETNAIEAVIGNTCGFTEVKVYYSEYVAPASAPVWATLPTGNVKIGEDYDITLTDYVTGNPVPSISIESAVDGNDDDIDSNLYDYNDGYLMFTPDAVGTYTFTFTATNSEGEVDATLTVTAYDTYTILFSVNGNSLEPDLEIVQGQSLGTLPIPTENIPSGFTFAGWMVSPTHAYYDRTTAPTIVNEETVPESDMMLEAVFCHAGTSTTSWTLTNSAPADGNQVILAALDGTKYYAMNGPSGIEFTVSNNVITSEVPAAVFTASVSNESNYLIKDGNYLHFNSSALKIASGTTNGDITYTAKDGGYTLYANGRYMTYNSTSHGFGVREVAYGSDGSAATMYIFKQNTVTTDPTDYTTSVSETDPEEDLTVIDEDLYGANIISGEVLAISFENHGLLVIQNGGVLTMDDEAVLTNSTAANLIIEDGGQLICNNSVAATVIKTVSAAAKAKDVYGWNTISSPVHTDANDYVTIGAETTVNLTANAYDMFAYDEENMMWLNQKPGSGATGFDEMYAGQGYIYRNSAATDISFVGNTNAGDVTITLTQKSSGNLAGFNLIGNPYPHSIKKGSGQAIDNAYLASGFYVLSGGKWLAYTDNEEIVAKQGILVKTNSNNNSLTININDVPYTPASKYHNDNIKFMVSNSQHEDVVYAWFDKGIGLDKINHRDPEAPMLYISQAGKDYAIATMSDDTKAFDLNFKAKTTGKYTLSYKANGSYTYLHVIDRLTGEDVDMLLEGSYSFVGSPKDNENRFIVRLGYMPDYSEGNDEIFAYQSGNDIYVSGQGELQIFDVMGRFVMSERVNGAKTISADALSKGVYVLRIVDSEIKTQKMVVR